MFEKYIRYLNFCSLIFSLLICSDFAIFCLPENTLDVSYYLHFVFDPHQCWRLAIDAVYAAAGIDVSECDVCCKKVLRVSDVKTFQFNINICCTC